jgi:gliding motility-associated-like protein
MAKYILLFILILSGYQGKTQCLVNSLIINTAYDPVTGLSIPGGANGATPVPDPRWILTAVTPGVGAGIAATPIAGLIPVIPGSSANVILPLVGAWVSNPIANPGGWISCVNSNLYYTDGTGVTVYEMTLGRTFKMCSDDSITLDYYIANDNYCAGTNIDGNPLIFSQPASTVTTNYSMYTHVTQTVYLTAGSHTFNVIIANFNSPGVVPNPTGLNLYGTVSSATGTNSLISETNTTCGTYVCPCNMLGMPDSVFACEGIATVLTPTVTGSNPVLSYAWTPATGLSSSTILNPAVTTSTSGWYDLTVKSIIPFNLVVNGDFSGGNTGFSSSYTFSPPPTSVIWEGEYSVYNNPNAVHSGFTAFGDHTSGTGNMMIINGGPVPNDIWCQTIAVTPNTDYDFSAWFANASPAGPGTQPILQFKINGVLIGAPTNITTVPGVWVSFSALWNSGTATSANICIYDLQTSAGANDFVIDDITFRQICSTTDSVYVKITLPDTTHTNTDTALCNTGNPVTLSATAGFTTHVWSTGSTAFSITAGTSGTYWVYNSSSCVSQIDTFHVSFKPTPSVSLGNDVTFCQGDSAVFFSPQPADYHYLWSTGSNATSIRVLTAGVFWLVVSTDDGCFHSDTVNTFINPVHADFVAIDDTICTGGTISFNDASTPAGTFSAYSWQFGDGITDLTIGSPSHTYTLAGEYPVTLAITDTLGCKASITKNVYALTVTISSFLDTTLCVSQPFAMTNEVKLWPNIAITDSDYTYQWFPANNLTATDVKTPYYSGLGLTTYTVVATLKNAPYCFATDTIRIHSVLGVLLANVTPNQTIDYGSSIHLNADSEVYYVWKPNDGSLSDPNISNPIAKPDVTTIYTVYGFDGNGCVDSAFVTVSIDSNMAECIPSAFTPNSDGLNDIFRPACKKFQRLVDFRIFNRWGRQVFYSNSFKNGWDGTLNGEPQDLGVYFYVITVAKPGDKGENVVYKGDVTLIR